MSASNRLGRAIRAARMKSHLSSVQLAKRADVRTATGGLGDSWIRQLEAGGIGQPDLDKVRRIFAVLGMDPTLHLNVETDEAARAFEMLTTIPPWERLLEGQRQLLICLTDLDKRVAAMDRRLDPEGLAAEIRTEVRETILDAVREGHLSFSPTPREAQHHDQTSESKREE